MNKEELELLLKKAVTSLFVDQPDIYGFTPSTLQPEWNLAHHLANEIHKFFPRLSCDLDITKPNDANKRPDIIFHKRGRNDSNFLVIEVKRNGAKKDLENDAEKIKSFWFRRPLRYQFGAVVNLKTNKTADIRVLINS